MITKRVVTAALLDLCLQIRSLCRGRQDTQHAFGARLCEASVSTTVEEDHQWTGGAEGWDSMEEASHTPILQTWKLTEASKSSTG